VLNHTDANREDGLNHMAPITCILPMPHNVYTGDDEGRVVRYFFFHLKEDQWTSCKMGWTNQVERKGGTGTKAVWASGGADLMGKETKREDYCL
jgi:hypothetical protein